MAPFVLFLLNIIFEGNNYKKKKKLKSNRFMYGLKRVKHW